MRSGRLRASEITQTARSRISTQDQAFEREVLSLDPWRPNFEDSVDEMLASALVAQDKELAHILQEVDKISKTLKSDAPDTQTLSNTLERTVLCAVKQSLLDRELRSLALTDDLTCLYNRRAFLALTSQQLRVTRRKAQGLLLFFADVDNLKEINDAYGHREGKLPAKTGKSSSIAWRGTFRDQTQRNPGTSCLSASVWRASIRSIRSRWENSSPWRMKPCTRKKEPAEAVL